MAIKEKIQNRGFTISQVASLMSDGKGGRGISQSALSQIINGNPSLGKLKEIAEIIGITVSELVCEDDSRETHLICPHCGKPIKIKAE